MILLIVRSVGILVTLAVWKHCFGRSSGLGGRGTHPVFVCPCASRMISSKQFKFTCLGLYWKISKAAVSVSV